MTLFTDIANLGIDAHFDMFGEDVTFTPAAGTGDAAARVVFGAERQDEMSVGDGVTRKLLAQVLIRRTGTGAIADPRYEDILSRGPSTAREEWQITDIVEQNAAASIVLCRRRYRNETKRTGFRRVS